jgi:hypothetical protein
MQIFLWILALVVVATLAAFAYCRFRCRRDRFMQALATGLGLPVSGGDCLLPGRRWGLRFTRTPLFILDLWRGRELNVHYVTKPIGRKLVTIAAIDVPHGADRNFVLAFGLASQPQVAIVATGTRPAATGDADFDRLFSIRSNEPELVPAVLKPELRAAVARAWRETGARGQIVIHEGRVHYEEPASTGATARVRLSALSAVCNAAAEAVDAVVPPTLPESGDKPEAGEEAK